MGLSSRLGKRFPQTLRPVKERGSLWEEEHGNPTQIVGAVAMAVFGILPAQAQQLTVWHDLATTASSGSRPWGRSSPRPSPASPSLSLSFPTDQWFGRCHQARSTQTPPPISSSTTTSGHPHRDADRKGDGPQGGRSPGCRTRAFSATMTSVSRPTRASRSSSHAARADGVRRAQELARQERRQVSPRPGTR